jgi:glycosyltransferase involved in cell wall biosynthesis
MNSVKLSLIIPTYNKIERLKLTLSSISKQTLDPNLWEVVLVDDGSDQDVYSVVKNMDFNLNYIYQNNGGRSSARNTGIQYAKGELIVFSDDDLIASPQFLESHFNAHTDSHKKIVHGAIYEMAYYKFFLDPLNGVLLPQYSEDMGKKLKNLKAKTPLLSLAINNFAEFSKYFEKKSKFEQDIEKELSLSTNERAVPWLGFTGGNVSIKKCWLEHLGGFDENLGKEWGAEDIELGYRLYNLGFIWTYMGSASNYHISHYRENFMELGKKSHNYCQKKHHSKEMDLLWLYLSGDFDIETFNKSVKEIKETISI